MPRARERRRRALELGWNAISRNRCVTADGAGILLLSTWNLPENSRVRPQRARRRRARRTEFFLMCGSQRPAER